MTVSHQGAIFEFIDGLPDNHVLIPKWVMEDLAIDEQLAATSVILLQLLFTSNQL